MTSFYIALKAELDKAGAELERVDADNWEARLNELKAEQGTWQKVAELLDTDRRTIDRWRNGYQPRAKNGVRPERRQVNPDKFVPRIRAAFKGRAKDRRAQVAAVDWSKLFITGTLVIGNYPPKVQRMWLGSYFTPASNRAIAAAYIGRKRWDMADVIDKAISDDYIGSPVHLSDVSELHF